MRKLARLSPLLAGLLLVGCQNFHEVKPGELYRSGQLSGPEFSEAIRKYGIKTVINLRGENPKEAWYQAESAAVAAAGALHVSIPMSASALPHRANLLKLIDAFETAPRPILIHCKAGADRTGEAVAMYAMDFWGASNQEALAHLDIKYLHVQAANPAKDYFIQGVYEGKDWAKAHYDPCQADYPYYDKSTKHCR